MKRVSTDLFAIQQHCRPGRHGLRQRSPFNIYSGVPLEAPAIAWRNKFVFAQDNHEVFKPNGTSHTGRFVGCLMFVTMALLPGVCKVGPNYASPQRYRQPIKLSVGQTGRRPARSRSGSSSRIRSHLVDERSGKQHVAVAEARLRRQGPSVRWPNRSSTPDRYRGVNASISPSQEPLVHPRLMDIEDSLFQSDLTRPGLWTCSAAFVAWSNPRKPTNRPWLLCVAEWSCWWHRKRPELIWNFAEHSESFKWRQRH
jgi:hypothetical protein